MAEAALKLNGVFEAAQEAANQYLENLRRLSREQESVQAEIEAEARKKADAMLSEAEIYSRNMRAQANAYWEQVRKKAETLLQDQDNLRSLIEAGIGTDPV